MYFAAFIININIRFNPLPASMPGESHVLDMHAARLLSFNPLPASMPGELEYPRVNTGAAQQFQSAPGIDTGRICESPKWRRN